MHPDFWLIAAGAGGFVILLESVLFIIRHYRTRMVRTLLKRAKDEVREISQFTLRVPYPLIMIGEDNKIVFINPAAYEAFPNLYVAGVTNTSHPIIVGAKQTENRDVTIGDKSYYQSVFTVEREGHTRYLLYCYDITYRKLYEEKLERAHRHADKARLTAEEATEARGRFLTNMSHELRTPMNGIIGLSDILMESGLPEGRQELIEAINHSARGLLVLLNDILDFSKIEAGELTMEHISFNLRETVMRVHALHYPVAARKRLAFMCNIDESVPSRLMGDPARLQQILHNLANNAIKFTEQGSVTIAVEGEPGAQGMFNLVIAVTDTGIGIPRDKQETIFDTFQQGDASTARKYGGTGLGLSITRTLTEMIHGRLALKSVAGKGSTFSIRFTLPIAEDSESEVSAVSPTTPIFTAEAFDTRILIVDDHPVNLLFLRQCLSRMGFAHIDEAASGIEALQSFASHKQPIILMDCQMPEMDGYETAEHIRQDTAAEEQPYIVAITADAMKGAQDKCIRAGMDDYISKPVDREKLYNLLIKRAHLSAPVVHTEPAQNDDAIFDFDHLREFTGGDANAENEIISVFGQSLRDDIDVLESNLQNEDLHAWERTAHKLHGACANVGARRMASVCDKVHYLPLREAEDIRALHSDILSEYASIVTVLGRRQSR